MTILRCLANEIYLELLGREHEKVGREPRPVGIGAHLEKNRRTRGLARGNPQQNAQADQGSRPGRRRGVEVDGHSGLVARRHHLHWRILQEGREAYLRQGRVSSTRVSTETYAARSTSTKEKKLTSPPSRRSFAKRSPSTVLASRNLRRKRSPKGFRP